MDTRATDATRTVALGWVLRVGVALCFVGHGAFGLRRKAGWLPLFAAAGVGPDAAHRLMPAIGAADVAVGLLALAAPRTALLVYAVGWTVWTAALRPIAGLPVWEAVERAGNYGVPLALLLLSAAVPAEVPAADTSAAGRGVDGQGARGGRWRAWLGVLHPRPLTPSRVRLLRWTLAGTTALLLLGHAALALSGKPELVAHAALLAPARGAELARAAGLLELALAALVLWRPTPALALGIAGWKLATEALFLATGAPGWEVVERAGSYAAPLALALLLWPVGARGGQASTPDRGKGIPHGRTAAAYRLARAPRVSARAPGVSAARPMA